MVWLLNMLGKHSVMQAFLLWQYAYCSSCCDIKWRYVEKKFVCELISAWCVCVCEREREGGEGKRVS